MIELSSTTNKLTKVLRDFIQLYSILDILSIMEQDIARAKVMLITFLQKNFWDLGFSNEDTIFILGSVLSELKKARRLAREEGFLDALNKYTVERASEEGKKSERNENTDFRQSL